MNTHHSHNVFQLRRACVSFPSITGLLGQEHSPARKEIGREVGTITLRTPRVRAVGCRVSRTHISVDVAVNEPRGGGGGARCVL